MNSGYSSGTTYTGSDACAGCTHMHTCLHTCFAQFSSTYPVTQHTKRGRCAVACLLSFLRDVRSTRPKCPKCAFQMKYAGLQHPEPGPKLPNAAVLASQADAHLKYLLECAKPANASSAPATRTILIISALTSIALQRQNAVARAVFAFVSMANEVSTPHLHTCYAAVTCMG